MPPLWCSVAPERLMMEEKTAPTHLTDESFEILQSLEEPFFMLIKKIGYTKDNLHNGVVRIDPEGTGNYHIYIGSHFVGYSADKEKATTRAKESVAKAFGDKYKGVTNAKTRKRTLRNPRKAKV